MSVRSEIPSDGCGDRFFHRQCNQMEILYKISHHCIAIGNPCDAFAMPTIPDMWQWSREQSPCGNALSHLKNMAALSMVKAHIQTNVLQLCNETNNVSRVMMVHNWGNLMLIFSFRKLFDVDLRWQKRKCWCKWIENYLWSKSTCHGRRPLFFPDVDC